MRSGKNAKDNMFSFDIDTSKATPSRPTKMTRMEGQFRNACGCYSVSNTFLIVGIFAAVSVAGVTGAYFAGMFSQAIDPSSSTSPINVKGKTTLTVAGRDALYFLEQILDDDSAVPAARSYNGYDWEGVQPLNLKFSCSTNSCETEIPKRGSWYVRAIDTSHLPSSPSAPAARFLNQATFGARRADVEAFKSPSEWIRDQFDMSASLHRKYYRGKVDRGAKRRTKAASCIMLL